MAQTDPGFLVAALVFFAVTPASSSSQVQSRVDTVSAPIANVHYEVTFNRTTAARGTIEVAMSFRAEGTGLVYLSLPAWTPGAYEISNFAKNITAFDATSGGQPLVWDKMDFDTWRIRAAAARPVEVRFRYLAADSLDNAKAWVKPDFALVNGTNVFLYPEGRPLDFPATVTINTEPDWLITTGMPRVGAGQFAASNYHDLVDMPFFIGHFDLDSSRVSEKTIRFASYPAGRVAGTAREEVWHQLAKVIPPEIAVFGEAPWDSYTVMEIVDSTFGGASGLEHQNSHVDVVSPQMLGSDFQPSLYAHETFHSWNVKRLRPLDLWPYVYSRPQPTPLLWFSEGITDYYADLALVRGHVIPDSGFLALTSGKINEVLALPATSAEDASLSTWVHPVDGTEYLYYPKGSLIGLMLDILIRDATDNARSLDTVRRDLYQTPHKRGNGFTEEDLWAAVRRAAGGRSFADVYTRYVDGREPLPWDSILPKAGLRTVQLKVPRLGILSQGTPGGVVVSTADPNGAAFAAGVRAGDYLLSVGSITVDGQDFGEKFRGMYGSMAEGSPLPIRVRRGIQELTLAGQLRLAPGDIRVEIDPAATEKAIRIRKGIVGQ